MGLAKTMGSISAVKTLALLATGKCKESPFGDSMVMKGRELVLAEIDRVGGRSSLDKTEGQPFLLGFTR